MPGSPWENRYNESLNGTFRGELLNQENFATLLETKVLIEQWKKRIQSKQAHSLFNYQPPAPETINPKVKTLT